MFFIQIEVQSISYFSMSFHQLNFLFDRYIPQLSRNWVLWCFLATIFSLQVLLQGFYQWSLRTLQNSLCQDMKSRFPFTLPKPQTSQHRNLLGLEQFQLCQQKSAIHCCSQYMLLARIFISTRTQDLLGWL